MKKALAALLALGLLAAACSPSAMRLRDKALRPYAVDIRLGESIRQVMREHPAYRSLGEGIYWWEAVGPQNERRRVSLRTDADEVRWFQVQDSPVAAGLADEERRFAAEVARLSGLLGVGASEIGHGGDVSQVIWRLPDGGVLLLRLEIAPGAETAVRTLGVGAAKYNLLPLLKEPGQSQMI